MWPAAPYPLDDPPRRLLLVRHGRTAWNVERRWQGHADVPLDDVGREQTRRLAAALSGEQFDHVVSSDLVRARATAEALVGPDGFAVDPRLREIDVGAWEGLDAAGIESASPGVVERIAAGDDLPLGEGETPSRFRARCLEALADAARDADGGTLLLVCHGGTVKVLVAALLGMQHTNVGRLQTGVNTGVTEFHFVDRTPRLVRFCDGSHLA